MKKRQKARRGGQKRNGCSIKDSCFCSRISPGTGSKYYFSMAVAYGSARNAWKKELSDGQQATERVSACARKNCNCFCMELTGHRGGTGIEDKILHFGLDSIIDLRHNRRHE